MVEDGSKLERKCKTLAASELWTLPPSPLAHSTARPLLSHCPPLPSAHFPPVAGAGAAALLHPPHCLQPPCAAAVADLAHLLLHIMLPHPGILLALLLAFCLALRRQPYIEAFFEKAACKQRGAQQSPTVQPTGRFASDLPQKASFTIWTESNRPPNRLKGLDP
eukprot:1156036-Pelagomonas_calceolata.AAC.3